MLRSLSVKLKRNFYRSQLESNKNILFESENKKGFIHGFSENYVRVKKKIHKEIIIIVDGEMVNDLLEYIKDKPRYKKIIIHCDNVK